MADNSIITKFELSEREKKLKADFFSRKTNTNYYRYRSWC